MLLSILIPGKNDNFRENTKQVLDFNINKTIDNINRINSNDIELVICDWGSKNKIIDNIVTNKCLNFKYIYVDPTICAKYNGDSNYSIVHPINTAFRQSSGQYVIFWDSDCYVTYDNFNNLYSFVKKMQEINDMKFYWGSRYNIPIDEYLELQNYTKLDELLDIKKISSYTKDHLSQPFMGTSISILMNRVLWQESSGWWERLTYWGWQDIEFHRRLTKKYQYGGDLDNYHIKFIHLASRPSHISKANPHIDSINFIANNESWGLINEKLEVSYPFK